VTPPTPPTAPAPTPATTLARSPSRLWRAARAPLVVGALLVLTGVLVAAVTDRGERGYLDPDAIDERGSRAVVELLRDQGVTVTVTGDTALVRAAGAGTTVLVPFPEALPDAQLAALRETAADVVLVQPAYEVARIAPGLEIGALSGSGERREPGCTLPAAVAAGALQPAGSLYTAAGGTACYPEELGAALVEVRDGARTVTALGDPAPLLNGTITEEGHAALALGLLGRRADLLWFAPGPADLAGEQRTFGELVPDAVRWAAVQLGIAAVLLVLWRARRLGPVVREPLPVVVRASEAVEGRARLYRRAGARGHAAETLREATRARLRPLVGLPPDAGPAELVDAVGARAGRRDVRDLLYGPPPGDDAGLVALARALDECEGEVRRS
jgi:hypothetical protein